MPRSPFHDLRHAAATFALSQGFTLEDMKQLLGHSSIVLTSNTYGHILEQRQRQGADRDGRGAYAGEFSQGDLTIGVQNFLFRIGPVVAKVYVTGFDTSLEDGLPLAQAAAAHTEKWLSEQPDTSPTASLAPEPSVGPSTSPAPTPGPVSSVDPDTEAVRQWASGASASSEYGSDLWAALQATGEPDVATYADDPASWAPSGSEAGIQSLELTFDQSVVPSAVTVVESLGSGAVILVEVFDPSAERWEIVWSGQSPATEAISTFSPPLAEVRFATDRVRITLDTDLVPGYNEIDAVELVGTPP